jgi:hypothetical protein
MSLLLRGSTWHIRKTVAGVMIAESTKTGNRRLAEQIMAKRVSEVTQAVMLGGKKPIKLHKAIDEFIASRAQTAGGKTHPYILPTSSPFQTKT